MSISKNGGGIAICLIIAVVASFLGQFAPVVGAPVISILIGIVVALFLKEKKENFSSGINWVSKKVLQYAVILLGFGLNLKVIISVGRDSLPVIISTIAISLIVSYFVSKALNIPKKISILVGVGSSICGGSAIAATSTVIDADSDEIAQAISVIFLFNVIAALIFPTLGQMLGMSNHGFSIFAGTAVNDTSSVTAAASAWDSIHHTGTMVLDQAAIVKLTRTLAIIPITFALSIKYSMDEHGGRLDNETVEDSRRINIRKMIPSFILYFVLCSIFTTLIDYMIDNGVISSSLEAVIASVFSKLKHLSKFFIVMAMGAIGLNTDIVKLIKTGSKPVFLGFCCWVAIILMSIGVQHIFGIL